LEALLSQRHGRCSIEGIDHSSCDDKLVEIPTEKPGEEINIARQFEAIEALQMDLSIACGRQVKYNI
jgi:hypothetical protein